MRLLPYFRIRCQALATLSSSPVDWYVIEDVGFCLMYLCSCPIVPNTGLDAQHFMIIRSVLLVEDPKQKALPYSLPNEFFALPLSATYGLGQGLGNFLLF